MFKNVKVSSIDAAQKLSKPKFPSYPAVKRWLAVVIILLAVGGIATSIYYSNRYRQLKANPDIEAQKETETLVSAVSKIMELPADETPTVATIMDKDKLKDQPFFAKAENGDKLLAYTKAMQAILYRPSTNKIINVAPIFIDQKDVAKQEKSATVALTGLKIAYYNGTESIELAGESEKLVQKTYPLYQTGVSGDASKKDYKETLVIDLTGAHSKEAGQIAGLLGGRVSSLPEGEGKPDADILVISGK
ncbi:MAG: hypothetical protein WC310_01945 [Patescibacteria group bacterium]|jgi:hypothetical protein